MKTIKRTETYNASAYKVFNYLDDLGVTGMHMTQSSLMMMGSKLNLEFISTQHKGLGFKYRWTGRMMGIKMDFTVEVTKWVEGVEKIWETVGNARMIIYSWYRMHLIVITKDNMSEATLSITYRRPNTWFAKVLSFLFANWYCNWCLKNMLLDSKRKVESEGEKISNKIQ